ncbi:MAG: hypothetical protein PWR20_1394 [Bacteroidales bacterium]|jgi:tRNA U34 5-methylaminomethyl-2-thiouridine-forming methyltransferase MnmC|nr:hypothetical protein [Bacteroidales bacterium]MDN5329352.1 hypothetical protein [Bacteroidales bacterium]
MDKASQPISLSLRITADGSHTLWSEDWGEPFHSLYGAIQESQYVFINAGLAHCSVKFEKINLLEIGLGTGLNALLAWNFAISNCKKIDYTGIEPFPLPKDLISQLNYPQILTSTGSSETLQYIHEALYSGKKKEISNFFVIQVIREDFRQVNYNPEAYHCIFFDAFDPTKVPELWTADAFRQLWGALSYGGVLVTYSAKGQIKRNLQEAGFKVEKLPGPPGKREIIRALKVS